MEGWRNMEKDGGPGRPVQPGRPDRPGRVGRGGRGTDGMDGWGAGAPSSGAIKGEAGPAQEGRSGGAARTRGAAERRPPPVLEAGPSWDDLKAAEARRVSIAAPPMGRYGGCGAGPPPGATPPPASAPPRGGARR